MSEYLVWRLTSATDYQFLSGQRKNWEGAGLEAPPQRQHYLIVIPKRSVTSLNFSY